MRFRVQLHIIHSSRRFVFVGYICEEAGEMTLLNDGELLSGMAGPMDVHP